MHSVFKSKEKIVIAELPKLTGLGVQRLENCKLLHQIKLIGGQGERLEPGVVCGVRNHIQRYGGFIWSSRQAPHLRVKGSNEVT